MQADWKAFTDEIAGVDMEWIRNEREKEKERKEQEKKLKEELLQGLPQTLTRGLTGAMASAQLSSPGTGRPANPRYMHPPTDHQIPPNPFTPSTNCGSPFQNWPQLSPDKLNVV